MEGLLLLSQNSISTLFLPCQNHIRFGSCIGNLDEYNEIIIHYLETIFISKILTMNFCISCEMLTVKVVLKGQTEYNLSRGELLMKLIFITLSGEYRLLL